MSCFHDCLLKACPQRSLSGISEDNATNLRSDDSGYIEELQAHGSSEDDQISYASYGDSSSDEFYETADEHIDD